MAHDRKGRRYLTAAEAGLRGCGRCGRVNPASADTCARCGSVLEDWRRASLDRLWAWWFAGLIAYIPANAYPMLRTNLLGTTTESTILGGVLDLLHHGSFGIAAIVFVASIIIPCGKFIAIAFLAISIRRGTRLSEHHRTILYEIVEFIGRWSMIDVFVVAILAALVNLGIFVGFKPGLAAFFFALSVAFTMLSALSINPKLLWGPPLPSGTVHD